MFDWTSASDQLKTIGYLDVPSIITFDMITSILGTFYLSSFDYRISTLDNCIYLPLDGFVSITFEHIRTWLFLPSSSRIKRWLTFFGLAPTQLAFISYYSLICTYILYTEHLNTIIPCNEINFPYTL